MKTMLFLSQTLLSTSAALFLSTHFANAQTVKPIGATALKKQIAASENRVTIVNFWATWCLPCAVEMLHPSKLRKNYAARGLNLVLVSFNERSEAQSKVQPFLKQNALPFSWILQGLPTTFVKSFDPKLKTQWELPRTYVYNRRGQLVQSFSGEKSYAQWEKLLKPWL